MIRYKTLRDNNGLSLAEVKKAIPSIAATHAHSRMSDRYCFLSTEQIVAPLLKDGFRIVEAGQRATRCRDPKYTRHTLRLRAPGAKPIVGDTFPELMFVNSHDGQSRWTSRGGLYRLACLNGLVTSIASTAFITTHRGDLKEIMASIMQVVEKTPLITKAVERMTKKKLTVAQQNSFATKALRLTHDTKLPFDPKLLLQVRRTQDEGNDVWSVYNRVQENLITGGVHFTTRSEHRRAAVTRGITHIGRNVEVNTGLWTLAEAAAA